VLSFGRYYDCCYVAAAAVAVEATEVAGAAVMAVDV
jgi:hypothetical protein